MTYEECEGLENHVSQLRNQFKDLDDRALERLI